MTHQDLPILKELRGLLTPVEQDLLRRRLSFECARLFHEVFDLPEDEARRLRMDLLMTALAAGRALPDYGLAYRGRPTWMTEQLLRDLQDEADHFAPSAYMNAYQQIARVDSDHDDTACERFARSGQLVALVRAHAGNCVPLHITSYLYYDCPQQFCEPHTDTQLIPISVLVELRHEWTSAPRSRTVSYWPHQARLEHLGEPGEISVFFGSHALHGRTAPGPGERIQALLMSFGPRCGEAVRLAGSGSR
jgi:hypothetical protein